MRVSSGSLFAAVLVLTVSGSLFAQSPTAQTGAVEKAATAPTTTERDNVGDQPDDPGPLATDLSPKLAHKDIHAAMKKVADWQLRVAEPHFNRQWTYAPLYDGFLAASKTLHDNAYHDAVLHYAEQQQWMLQDARFPHADDIAFGQPLMDLYFENKDPQRMANVKANMDRLLARPDDPAKDLWWWCDALFMAPQVLARVSKATGDRKYLTYMDHEWDLTTEHLYSPEYHLYFRDARYLKQTQANGKPIFWSRGNGWVVAGIVRVLEVLPANDPLRPKYEKLFRDLCAELVSIQGPDGLWRTGLLDPGAYDLPENSGSAFFTYAFAYGVNHKLLDRKTYLPAAEKGWAGLLTHVYADGRLGSIQPIDAQPGKFKPSASYVFGVGGFLMAGNELDQIAKK